MPLFMLQELFQRSKTFTLSDAKPNKEAIFLVYSNLLPGGISRNLKLKDNSLNRRFSNTVLESVKLLLAVPLQGECRH
jgi:hypothetical protein